MNTQEAVGEVRKFARFIKAFEHISEVAEALASADNVLKERVDQLAAIDATISENQGHLDGIIEAQQTQKDRLKVAADAAIGECEQLLSDASAEAGALVSEAQREVENISEQAQEAAIQLRALCEEITSTQTQLDELTAKLAEARQQARKILGGGE